MSDTAALAKPTPAVHPIPVGELAQRAIIYCPPDATVADAAARMAAQGCSSVIVAEGQTPVGIWTERDALHIHAATLPPDQTPLRDVMTPNPRSMGATESAVDAQAVMHETGIRHLLIVETNGALAGVLSQTDLVQSHGIETYLRLREVRTALGKRPLTLAGDTGLADVAEAMLAAGQSAALVALANGRYGIVTERDVVQTLASWKWDPAVAEVANTALIQVHADASLLHARSVMLEHKIRRVAVVDADDQILGLVGFDELMATSETGLIHELEQSLDETRSLLDTAQHQAQRRQAVQEVAPVGLLALDNAGVIQEANPMAAQLLGGVGGGDAASLIGSALAEWLPAFTLPDPPADATTQEVTFPDTNGQQRWLELVLAPLRTEAGSAAATEGLSVAVNDITARRQAEERRQALEAEQRLLATAFHTSHALMITDSDGVIERVNGAFSAITGYDPEEVIGATPRILQSGEHDTAFYEAMWERIQTEGRWEGEIWNQRKNGEVYPEWESIAAVYDDAGTVEHYVATFHDITEQKRLENQMEWLATHDRLTGLHNRAFLDQILEDTYYEYQRYQTPFSLLLFDIDDFKLVNDHYGHLTGDNILKTVASTVAETIRKTDYLARWGGEEFLVLAKHTPLDGAQVIAERIRQLVAEQPQEGPGQITISIGVAEIRPGDDMRTLEERVDQALYAAKAGGRNQVCLCPQTSEPIPAQTTN